MSYNHNEAERAAENEQIDEEASHSTENLSPQDPDSKVFSKISQSLPNPDESNIDDNHQRRNELTDDASKTQTQEPEDVDETHVHKERPEVDEGGESKQKDELSEIRKRNRSDQEKKENQNNTDRTGEDQVAAYSDRPQLYYDEERTVDMQKKHTKQKVHTSHDTQNKLDLKKTRKNKNYKMAATLTGNQEADRDEETRQENFQSYRNKGSKGTEARIQGSNQAAFERKTIEVDIREFSPGGKGKTKLMVKTITEEIKVVNSSSNRKTISNEGNVDCDLEDGDFFSAKEETTFLSGPLLREQQNPTSEEITRGAKQDEYRLNISPATELYAQHPKHMKKKSSDEFACMLM
ncbi:transcriptional regulator ATRX homolog [Xiphophorus maculatus]|uniref:transcriptional regulator ATRX homolog n=1 Tax=Xiphophorus maculatus TaxID=8083 RepID=UPI000C6CEC3C|nr:transcriptional regulator ATRX homolog [Xiphophorus maculatus]